MSFHTSIRLALVAALFASVFFAPPWAVAIIAIVLAARWRAWEVIGAGIIMDFLWLPYTSFTSLEGFPAATIISIVLVFGFEPIRRQLLLGPALYY